LQSSHFYVAGASILIAFLVITYAVLINTGDRDEGVISPGRELDQPALTATPPSTIVADSSRVVGSNPWPSQPLPTLSPTEEASVSETRLYLTAFQNGFISVVDPASGHALQQIPVVAQQAGMAISPDGSRLYVVDDGPQGGQLRVFDTATWQVTHREPVPLRAHLLGGNPISLSPDGRWLIVRFFDFERAIGWTQVFDTGRLEFVSEAPFEIDDCNVEIGGMAGLPNGPEVYVQCREFVAALRAEDLSLVGTITSPTPYAPDDLGWPRTGGASLTVSPDGDWLFGLYPEIERTVVDDHTQVLNTDLILYRWEIGPGERHSVISMSDRVSVPLATAGRGDRGYVQSSIDGDYVFVAWEDMLWSLDANSLIVVKELHLPVPVDGMVQSKDGDELYLLPSTAGDLPLSERGMFTVDATALELTRHAEDWPQLNIPFFLAAPTQGLASD